MIVNGNGDQRVNHQFAVLSLLLPQNTECLAQAILELQECALHVMVAHDFRELEAACNALRFHVAVLGPALGPRMKKAVASLLQEKCPHVPVIELGDKPVVHGAIHFLGESGPEFLAVIKAALARP